MLFSYISVVLLMNISVVLLYSCCSFNEYFCCYPIFLLFFLWIFVLFSYYIFLLSAIHPWSNLSWAKFQFFTKWEIFSAKLLPLSLLQLLRLLSADISLLYSFQQVQIDRDWQPFKCHSFQSEIIVGNLKFPLIFK